MPDNSKYAAALADERNRIRYGGRQAPPDGDWARDRSPDWAGAGFQARRLAAEPEREREAG